MAAVENHPGPGVLEDFVLGRLDSGAMRRVEAHLGGCPACLRVAERVPADRLVALIRRDAPSAPPASSEP